MENIEDQTTEQLRKLRKTYLAIMLVPFLLLLISLGFAAYVLGKGEFDSSTALIVIPVIVIASILPSYIQFKKINSELKRRRGQ